MIMKLSEPNFRWTGLLTVAPSAGSTKKTRGDPAGFVALAAGLAAGADEAGLDESGVPDEQAATRTIRATRASCFMRCLLWRTFSFRGGFCATTDRTRSVRAARGEAPPG